MEYKQIQELIKAINKSNISELSIEEGDFKITIKQAQTISETQVVAYQPAMQQMPAMLSHAPAQPAVAPPAAAQTPGQPAAPAEAPAGNLITIKSPMIGTFYRSSAPDKPSFVNVGDEIRPGQVICIVEAMKLFNEIECEVSGKIVKVLIDDASPVEYDQPLFLVEPA
jgi:acetyl-CoA carboxylase biotin carboxyl carrier protein